MLRKLNLLKILVWMQVLEGRKKIFIRHQGLLFQYLGTTAFSFVLLQSVEIKIWKGKKNKPTQNSWKKFPLLLQALKGLLTQISFSADVVKKLHSQFLKVFRLLLLGKKKKKKKLHLEIFLEMPPQSCLQNWSLGGSQLSGQIFWPYRPVNLSKVKEAQDACMGESKGEAARRGSRAGADRSSPRSLVPCWGCRTRLRALRL